MAETTRYRKRRTFTITDECYELWGPGLRVPAPTGVGLWRSSSRRRCSCVWTTVT